MVYHLRDRKKMHPPPNMDYEEEVDSEEESEDDPDYDPDETEYEEEEDEEEEEVEEEEEINFSDLGKNYRLGTSAPPILFLCPPNSLPGSSDKPLKKYSKEEKEYLKRLDDQERKRLLELESHLGNTISKDLMPLRFKILSSKMEDGVKRIILNKLDQFSQMNEEYGEYYKLKNWLDNISQIPFQTYVNIPVTFQDPIHQIAEFMNNTKEILDKTVYGHVDAKQQILRILAQWISNPGSHGHCIGIHGPMGIGKTCLIKEGLSKALGIPFGFVALGGATDGSFLEGHSYTYEGSTYGKICEILIKTQCNNPIIFFDELDKVSSTKKGEEISGILTHITDISQNEKFVDKYFSEIDLDLSRCLFVFSYNDESLVNPILKDRLITIKAHGYKKTEKLIIAKEYLLPNIFKNYGFQPNDILLDDSIIHMIIDQVPEEEGVRNLKRGLETIISWINMYRYLPNDEHIQYPYLVTSDFVYKHIKRTDGMNADIKHSMYT